MVTEVDNTTLFPDKGDNSNVTIHSVTLRDLNDAEIERLIPTIVYLALLSLIGIVGNSLVCHVYRTRYRLSNSQCFILCLSAIDLFSCCVVIPFEIATIVDQYTFEYLWLCKLSRFFNTIGTLSASFLLLFIAIDRYRKVCQPFGWQIKSNVAKFLCVLSVLLGLVFSWPAIFIYGTQTFTIPKYGLNGTECSTDDQMLTTVYPLINAAVFGGLFVVGIISICILYCFIGKEIHKHAKKMPKNLNIRNTSVPMLSSIADARDSRISGEIDPNLLKKYNSLKTKKGSKRKSKSKRRSESSWTTERRDYELSCSMECNVKDTSVDTGVKDNVAVEDDTQSDDSGIKSDQTNKDESEDNTPKISEDNEVETIEEGAVESNRNSQTTEEHEAEDGDGTDNIEIRDKIGRLESVTEAHDVEQGEVPEGDQEDDERERNDLDDTATDSGEHPYRKMSELSYTSEHDKQKYMTFRTRLSSIGSRITNAVIRRMTSVVSNSASLSSLTVAKTQYLKQARARKTAFLMFLISLAFVISYMPHLMLMIVRLLRDNFIDNMSEDGRALYKFFLRSYFLNCAINPVIYGVCDSRFRTACKEIFSCCCCSKSRDFK